MALDLYFITLNVSPQLQLDIITTVARPLNVTLLVQAVSMPLIAPLANSLVSVSTDVCLNVLPNKFLSAGFALVATSLALTAPLLKIIAHHAIHLSLIPTSSSWEVASRFAPIIPLPILTDMSAQPAFILARCV